jgi:hypothetical protein
MGNEANSRRRAPALARGTTPPGPNAGTAQGAPWPAGHDRAQHRRPNPRRTGRRQKSGSDRPRTQQRPDTDCPRRRALVAVNGACRASPIRGLTLCHRQPVHNGWRRTRWWGAQPFSAHRRSAPRRARAPDRLVLRASLAHATFQCGEPGIRMVDSIRGGLRRSDSGVTVWGAGGDGQGRAPSFPVRSRRRPSLELLPSRVRIPRERERGPETGSPAESAVP